MKIYRFLISGGGTGGHIYPAISIADELSKSFISSEILFVGSIDRMETVSYTHLRAHET